MTASFIEKFAADLAEKLGEDEPVKLPPGDFFGFGGSGGETPTPDGDGDDPEGDIPIPDDEDEEEEEGQESDDFDATEDDFEDDGDDEDELPPPPPKQPKREPKPEEPKSEPKAESEAGSEGSFSMSIEEFFNSFFEGNTPPPPDFDGEPEPGECEPSEDGVPIPPGGKAKPKKKKEDDKTPEKLARKMVEMAEVEPGMLCLEPCAGSGTIARILEEVTPYVDVIEYDDKKRDDLFEQGFAIVGTNFFESKEAIYDKIVLHAPFGLYDLDYVEHAYDCLDAGGRLIALVSDAVITEQSHPYIKRMQDWLVAHQGRGVPVKKGEYGMPCNAFIVTINKPFALPTNSKRLPSATR